MRLYDGISLRRTPQSYWRRLKQKRVEAEDVDVMWEAMSKCIRRLINEILGTSKGGGGKINGAWWWNEDVKENVKEKQEACAALVNSGIDKEKEVDKARHQPTKKVVKKVVVVAKNITYQ